MTKYKYDVVYSAKFKKGLKKVIKQGKDIDKLEPIVFQLANKDPLEPKYKNHHLVDNKYYKDCFECHIEPYWLLVYQYNEDKLILFLMNTGSHSEVFKK